MTKDTSKVKPAIHLSSPDMVFNIWACGGCGVTTHTEKEAFEHCAPSLCDCGALVEIYRTVCSACSRKESDAREQARWDKAKKIPYNEFIKYGEYLYSDQDENYYCDLDSLFDSCDDLENLPTWAWGTEKQHMTLDADQIVEQALEEHAEDAIEQLPGDAIEELQKTLNAWCEKNPIFSYFPDGTVVMFEKEADEYRAEREAEEKSA